MAKAYFKEHNISYNEYNVALDQAKRAEMIEKTGQLGVPVIEIDGNIVVGFYKPKVAELLGLTAVS